MKLSKITPYLNEIAPLELAEGWDNVGLLAGDPNQNVRNIILAVDLTRAVLDEAKAKKADLVLAYHPPIFDPLKKIVPGVGASGYIYELIKSKMALYSMHTALDMAEGGINDVLAEIVGIEDAMPLAPAGVAAASEYKIVVFVPVNELETVSEAMFAAGAGVIGENGKYSKCSYRVDGTGTFQCGAGSNPSIGKPGSFEQVNEYRLETIVSKGKLTDVISAMVEAHSYEEVAYDIYPLAESKSHGFGRFGKLAKPVSKKKLIEKIKAELKVKTVGIIGSEAGTVSSAAVGAGSCGSLLNNVIANKCDFYLTGELKHHDALKLQEAGITTVCVSHSNSERVILRKIAAKLNKQLEGVKVFVSTKDKDPFTWK